MPPTLADSILAAIEPVDATLFELVATGPNLPLSSDVDAYEAEVGFALPTEFRALVESALGGLYVRAREQTWPLPQPLEIVEFGYFQRGVAILGMATDIPLPRLDLRFALEEARELGLDGFAPVLTLDGDDSVYGFDASGSILVARGATITRSESQDFAAIYSREIAALIERQVRYGRTIA